ncbi:MAG: GAF domain-containing protein [Myxococcota bacterium]
MPKFEVYIPAVEPGGFNLTLKVGADNWMAALKAGMQKLGEQGAVSQNVMVDIQDDNSIHVTEAASGRVFRIRELTAEEVAKAQVKRPSQIRTAPVAPEKPPFQSARAEVKTEPGIAAVAPAQPPVDVNKTIPVGLGPPPVVPAKAPEVKSQPAPLVSNERTMPLGNNAPTQPGPKAADKTLTGLDEPPPPRRVKPSASQILRGRVEVVDVEELVQPVKPVTGSIGRVKSSPQVGKTQRQLTEDLLAEVFMRVVELDKVTSVEDAAKWVLDLAIEKIPCEAGAVFHADGATGDLTFLHAFGPKAQELMRSKITIPAGTGIAGFCAAEGVSVAVSDVEKDPRFYAAIGERVGFQTKSMLCSPMMTHGRSFGCMQIINRKGGPQFQEHEVGLLSYLAHQAALFMNSKL